MTKTQVLVIGSGPGGYTAAFRAADLGKQVTLVERYDSLGGVCLNVGCIPSKNLLHTADLINKINSAKELGIDVDKVAINIDNVRENKTNVVKKLINGIHSLARARKVKVVKGFAKFTSPNTVLIDTTNEIIEFEKCIIAVGSRVIKIPFLDYNDKRIMDSTDALELEDIPKRLLIIGGGIIGLEMAQIYDALGAKITIVEASENLIPAADKDIVRPLFKKIKNKYENIYLNTKVISSKSLKKGIQIDFKGDGESKSDVFDKVLVCVGRVANSDVIDIEKAGINLSDQGFIITNSQMRTNVAHIYAIGDVAGQPMLAHKASHQAKVAAEAICDKKAHFDALAIPSVVYTNPEIAWAGKTEKQLKEQGIEYTKGAFPWAASGRALSVSIKDGVTKCLFDKASGKIIGAGICGANAGDLIAELMLALEMACDIDDIALTVHAHPTLSETVGFAAELANGTITDLMPQRR